MRDEIKKFHETVDILVKAYLNDTLEHENCCACAVGNIIANKMDYKFTTCHNTGYRFVWDFMGGKYSTPDGSTWYDTIRYKDTPSSRVRKEIASTGYSITELSIIEWAFEKANYGYNDAEWMFNGLMAVVDVLVEIHGVDLSVKESAKALFVK